jgi:hypothetical protein
VLGQEVHLSQPMFTRSHTSPELSGQLVLSGLALLPSKRRPQDHLRALRPAAGVDSPTSTRRHIPQTRMNSGANSSAARRPQCPASRAQALEICARSLWIRPGRALSSDDPHRLHTLSRGHHRLQASLVRRLSQGS